MTQLTLCPRSALYLPASNARAIEKARTLAADMIMLDLEDAVPADKKEEARAAAVAAMEAGFGERMTAIRVNAVDTPLHALDIAAVAASKAQYCVVPKVDRAEDAAAVVQAVGKPVFAMIETPVGVLNAAAIAAVDGVVGLFAGINDLKNELHLPEAAGRDQVSLSLQMMVIAARAAGKWVLDSVYNELSNAAGLEAECVHGRLLGFDGKTLIHPNQIEAANRIWSPSEAEIADARAVIEAGKGGAVRMGERMVESMHVEAAKRLLAQARLTA
ncbi:MAG: CoA ester lyase [Sphingomonadales bacterium]|nr:CoA ester lyase [Sphingomonadales bacterium]